MNKFVKCVFVALAAVLCIGMTGCSSESTALKTQVEDRFDGSVVQVDRFFGKIKNPEKFGVGNLYDIPVYIVGTVTQCSTIDPWAEEENRGFHSARENCIYFLLQDRKGTEWMMRFNDPYPGLFDKLKSTVNQNVIVLGVNFEDYLRLGLILHDVDAVILENDYIRIDDPYGDITDEYVQSFRDQVGFESGLIEDETEPQYESAKYEDYNYPASANGKRDQKICFSGNIKNIQFGNLMATILELEDDDNNTWVAEFSSKSLEINHEKIEETFSVGEHISVYGSYYDATGDLKNIPYVIIDKIVDDSGQVYTIRNFYSE